MYSARHNLCHVQRIVENCTSPRCLWRLQEISAPFLEPWWQVCLLPLKIPLVPSPGGEGVFRAWALPSPFLGQWIKFLLCYAKPLIGICNSGQRTHRRVIDPLGVSNSMLYMKAVKRVNPESSHPKEKNISIYLYISVFFSISLILYLYEMMDVH